MAHGTIGKAAIDKIEMATRLVAFDTTSRNSNLALIEFVRDYLDGYGVSSELVFDASSAKANLYATIGDPDRSGIMLSGHTDVVPVDDQDWHTDPFTLVAHDDRLYGRGSADMKGFIATVLSLVPVLVERKLREPIHLSFSYDEEIGCVGVRTLINVLKDRPNKPRLCIVGEPTDMQVGVGHKGKHTLRCHVHGHEVHSSLIHQGVNAIEAAAELIAKLKEIARRKRDHGPFDPDFQPPYSSVHTGLIQGGTALNIVPRDCTFDFEVRPLPGDDVSAVVTELREFAATRILPEMHAVRPETSILIEELSAAPGLDTPADHEVTQLAATLSGSNGTMKVPFGTEGGLFAAAGIPAVICGPGSIDQAHKPDEFVALDQLARCEAFLRRLIDRVSQS
ncbi:MAG TPA: acetylornithine deacetylase [Stellaceae bacterium]|nr:acetylornithine deacetylase [Stellaceae bacterium]